MKFDINKEFSFSQIGNFIKNKFLRFGKTIKKLDSSVIKNINIKGRVVKVNAIRLGFIVGIFAVMLALFVNIVVLPNTTYRAYSDLEFDTGGQYKQYAFGNDMLLMNKNGLKLIDNKGGDQWTLSQILTNPMVDIIDDYVLLADLDGNNTLNLYNIKGKQILNYPISSDILSAKINKKLLAAVAIGEEGYKGAVVVYNKKAEEIFKWNSGEGYITDIDISNDGKYVAVAQMMSDKDETYSIIHVLNITNGQESGNVTCDKSLISKINFDKNDNIVAVGDNKIYGYTKKGGENFVIDLAGKSPQKYDVQNGNSIIVLCKDSRGNSQLEIYSLKGKYIGGYTSGDEIKNICTIGNVIVAASSRKLFYLNYNGKLKKTIEISHDIMSFGIYGNKRNALVLGGNKADIVRIR